MKKLKPTYLRLTDKECGLHSSHFFGNPSMPSHIPWPTHQLHEDNEQWQEPLDFICQIEYKNGLLLFFANIAYYAGWDAEPVICGNVSDKDVVRVFFIPKEEMSCLIERDDAEPLAQALPIEFSVERLPLGEPEHQLFGEPEHREWDEWDAPFEGWRLLFQMDSVEGSDYSINFMDCGVLNFIIDPDDLENGIYNNVRAIVLST